MLHQSSTLRRLWLIRAYVQSLPTVKILPSPSCRYVVTRGAYDVFLARKVSVDVLNDNIAGVSNVRLVDVEVC
jgi:hypothetical protein